jgi:hypothetical protein
MTPTARALLLVTLAALFVPMTAAAQQLPQPDAVTVTLSGKVGDATGTPLYASLVIYQSSDKQIVAAGNTGLGAADLGLYSFAVPPGTYDFYVRAFGYAPTELRNVSVQGNVTQNVTIDKSLTTSRPSYLTVSTTSTPAVFSGVASSSTTISITSTQDLGTTFTLFNEFGNFTVDGTSLGTFSLYDDGTHGDAVAHDHIYMRNGIGFQTATSNRCNTMGVAYLFYGRTAAGSIVAVPQVTVIGVNGTLPVLPLLSVTTNGPAAQFTAMSANVIVDATKSGWETLAVQQFERAFDDVYDFIFLFPDVLQNGAAGRTVRVRNNITGIGAPLLDISAQYGGTHTLQAFAIMNFSTDPPLNHEFVHRWGNDFAPPFDAAYISHWGYSSVNGVLGGFDGATLAKQSDGSYTVAAVAPNGIVSDGPALAPLEMYVAGFAPPSAVGTITSFTNVQPVGGSDKHFNGTRSDVTMASLIAKYGARSPAFEQSQKKFRVAFVGATRQPLNSAGMMYLATLAQQFAGAQCSQQSFRTAAQNVVTIDPSIAPRYPHARAARK